MITGVGKLRPRSANFTESGLRKCHRMSVYLVVVKRDLVRIVVKGIRERGRERERDLVTVKSQGEPNRQTTVYSCEEATELIPQTKPFLILFTHN